METYLVRFQPPQLHEITRANLFALILPNDKLRSE
jgi:hypothetical protein